ncbi:MAG: tetratricopeptide repeat protein [bacterium]
MRKVKILLSVMIFLGIFCIAINPVRALSSEQIFSQANQAYAEGDYSRGAKLYQEIINQGRENGNIYYNLGNAYFKLGQKGKALVNYQRALKLMPEDEDLFANIKFAESLLEIKQPEENYSWGEKIYFSLQSSFSTTQWFFLGLFIFLGACIFTLYLIFSLKDHRNVKAVVILIVLGFFMCNFFFYKSYQAQKNIMQGIVIVPKIEVRYSPSYSGAVAFELTEGMQTQILHVAGEWAQIRLNKKTSGWIETSAVEPI